MNKILCDICGSTYPESAPCCPICGGSREFGIENPDYVPSKMPEYIPENKKKHGVFSAAAKKAQDYIYDSDEPVFDAPMDVLPEIDDEEEPQDAPRGKKLNYFIVIVLTAVIGVCLLICGFLFVRYYIPHQFSIELPTKAAETEPFESVSEETSAPTIPCSSIVLTSGVPEINRIGQYWLLHVLVMPEDTTDKLTFTSSDESVVTVTEGGRICSVGEGQATVVIACGDKQILCQVTVKLPAEESSEETSPAESDPEPSAETTSDPVEPEQDEGIVLRLKQSDISFKKKGVTFQLELDCDLAPEDVAWMTLDPDVAICHDGLITVLGTGTTRIIAQYGDQQVYCIVRCDF